MRHTIETAPRDGKFVILEEDAGGRYGIAHWSPEAGGWLGENGEPIKVTPAYWYPIQGENYLQQGLDLPISLRPVAAPQRATASDVIASRSVAAAPVTVAAVGAQTTPVEPKIARQSKPKSSATKPSKLDPK